MDVGTEISHKIRSAIKAKLMELGAYVDDELPDYIMVMVANKKNRSQMASDLGLFLGTNTDAFTEWLHGLLGKLQTVNSDADKQSERSKNSKVKGSKERKREKKVKGNSASEKKKSSKRSIVEAPPAVTITDESLVLDQHSVADKISNATVNQDLDLDLDVAKPAEANRDQAQEKAKLAQTEATVQNVQDEVEDVRQLLVTEAPSDELAQELETTEEEVTKSKRAKMSSIPDRVPNLVSSKDVTVQRISRSKSHSPERGKRKRKAPVSVIASVSRSTGDEEEYDPYNPAVGSVASVVKVTARKSSVPSSLQANSFWSLLPGSKVTIFVVRFWLSQEEIKACLLQLETSNGRDCDSIYEIDPLTNLPSEMVKLSDTASLSHIKLVLAEILNSSQENRDDISVFTQLVETSLRKLEPSQLSFAKFRIQQVLFQFESVSSKNLEKERTENLFIQDQMSSDVLEAGSYCGRESSVGLDTGPHIPTVRESSLSNADGCESAVVNDCSVTKVDLDKMVGNKANKKTGEDEDLEFEPHQRKLFISSMGSKPRPVDPLRPECGSYMKEPSVSGKTASPSNAVIPEGEPRNLGGCENGKLFSASPQKVSRLQFPGQSSRGDADSPNVSESCPPSSTSGSTPTRRSIVSSIRKTKDSSFLENVIDSKISVSHRFKGISQSSKSYSFPSFLVDSIHSRRRPDAETPSVLKQGVNIDKTLKPPQLPESEEVVDSSKPISSEALRVMAKNLKVTVINKRASRTKTSSAEESSSDDSDEGSSDEDEETDEDVPEPKPILLETKEKDIS